MSRSISRLLEVHYDDPSTTIAWPAEGLGVAACGITHAKARCLLGKP
jgi:hypothetical protein